MGKIKILAIPGSLSHQSANARILRLIPSLTESDIGYTITDCLEKLPPFNPDLDKSDPPAAVLEFRSQLQTADAILICTPEYAFGVPGALKNALDWTVSSGQLVNKPLALITASLSGVKAHAALLETFTALSVNINPERTLLLSFIRSRMDEQGNLKNPDDIKAIQQVVHSLIAAVGA